MSFDRFINAINAINRREPADAFDEQLYEDIAEAQIDARCDPECMHYINENVPGCPWCTAQYLLEHFQITRKAS